MRMQSVLVVAKFKIRQYVVKTDLPNLMLAKFSRYTVDSIVEDARTAQTTLHTL